MYQTEVSGQSLSSGTTHSFAKSTIATTRCPRKSHVPRGRPEARQNQRTPRGPTLSAAGRTGCIPSRGRNVRPTSRQGRPDVAAISAHVNLSSESLRGVSKGPDIDPLIDQTIGGSRRKTSDLIRGEGCRPRRDGSCWRGPWRPSPPRSRTCFEPRQGVGS